MYGLYYLNNHMFLDLDNIKRNIFQQKFDFNSISNLEKFDLK